MNIEVLTVVAPQAVLLLPDSKGNTLQEVVYTTTALAIQLIEREVSSMVVREDITPEELKDKLDGMCETITGVFNSSIKNTDFGYLTAQLEWRTVTHYTLNVTPNDSAEYQTPSTQFH